MLKYKQIWHGIKPIRWLIKFNLTENPQEKEDVAEATSQDQESESTWTKSNPLLSLISLDLRATCS